MVEVAQRAQKTIQLALGWLRLARSSSEGVEALVDRVREQLGVLEWDQTITGSKFGELLVMELVSTLSESFFLASSYLHLPKKMTDYLPSRYTSSLGTRWASDHVIDSRTSLLTLQVQASPSPPSFLILSALTMPTLLRTLPENLAISFDFIRRWVASLGDGASYTIYLPILIGGNHWIGGRYSSLHRTWVFANSLSCSIAPQYSDACVKLTDWIDRSSPPPPYSHNQPPILRIGAQKDGHSCGYALLNSFGVELAGVELFDGQPSRIRLDNFDALATSHLAFIGFVAEDWQEGVDLNEAEDGNSSMEVDHPTKEGGPNSSSSSSSPVASQASPLPPIFDSLSVPPLKPHAPPLVRSSNLSSTKKPSVAGKKPKGGGALFSESLVWCTCPLCITPAHPKGVQRSKRSERQHRAVAKGVVEAGVAAGMVGLSSSAVEGGVGNQGMEVTDGAKDDQDQDHDSGWNGADEVSALSL